MRISRLLCSVFAALVFHVHAFAQEAPPLQILAEAERVFPDARVPRLFSKGSASAAYADEPEDPIWSAEMEARILLAVADERDQGLLIRRAEVECRFSSCALLLIHAKNNGEGSVGDLKNHLRDTLGFSGVSQSGTEIPMTIGGEREPGRGVSTWFLSGYVEILLLSGR